MSGIFGISGFNPAALLASAALGPMGGVVAGLVSQVFNSFGQALLQNLGQQMGLPQATINLAQDVFAATRGFPGGSFGGNALNNMNDSIEALGDRYGATPQQIGDAQRSAMDILLDAQRESGDSDEVRAARSGGKAPGWLMAMAQALGDQLNELGDEMTHRAETMTKDDPKASAEFSVVSQQFSMLMNATSNAIKTVGEAMANTARKQ